MQPGDQSIFDPSTSRAAGSGRPLPRLYRGRPVLAAFVAVLTELVVIAGVDNQGVSGALRDPLDDPGRVLADYTSGAIDAATAFWWRFAPADGQATHVWAAQFAAIGTLIVLTWLGTLAVARGSVSFGRVWVGTWAVVAASAPIAIMVRQLLVIPTAPGPAQSKVGQAVYGYDGLGPVVVAGIVLGFVAGLITAAVAVGSRRHVAAAAPVAGRGVGEQDEYYDDSFTPRYPQPQPYEPRPWGEGQWQGEGQTQAQGQAQGQAAQWQGATTQLPSVPPQQPWAGDSAFGATEQFAPQPAQQAEQPPALAQPPQPQQPDTPQHTLVEHPGGYGGADQPTEQVPRPAHAAEAAPPAAPVLAPEPAAPEPAAPEQVATEPAAPQQVAPREVASEDIAPAEAPPSEPQPPDAQPPDAQPTERQPSDIQPPDAQPTGVLPPVDAAARQPADEETMAEELAVEEHTQELPPVRDDGR
jgi:hypothetical protein